MDTFKSNMTKCCDVGGLKCDCCNRFRKGKKNKRLLRKIARANIKSENLKMKDES